MYIGDIFVITKYIYMLSICHTYTPHTPAYITYNLFYLLNTSNFKIKIKTAYALHMHKLSVVQNWSGSKVKFEVRTTLNFWTTPRFLRTTPSCNPPGPSIVTHSSKPKKQPHGSSFHGKPIDHHSIIPAQTHCKSCSNSNVSKSNRWDNRLCRGSTSFIRSVQKLPKLCSVLPKFPH